MKKSLIAAALIALPSFAQAATYEVDASHSTAGFSVRHLMVTNVRGEFGKVSGVLNLDEKDVTKSTVEATIDTATINTRDAKRDEHLRSPDFFDVAKFPAMTFKSKKVSKAGKDRLKVLGDLTIRDVTRPVTLEVQGPTSEVKDPWGNLKRGVSATTRINRKDFGLSWNAPLETGGVVVGEEVSIAIDLELVKKSDAAAAK